MTGIIEQFRTGTNLDRINNELLKKEVPIYWGLMQILGGIIGMGLTLIGLYIGMQVK